MKLTKLKKIGCMYNNPLASDYHREFFIDNNGIIQNKSILYIDNELKEICFYRDNNRYGIGVIYNRNFTHY